MSDPAGPKTREDHENAREYFIARDMNFLIDCILSDRNPITGGSIAEEEQGIYERWLQEAGEQEGRA